MTVPPESEDPSGEKPLRRRRAAARRAESDDSSWADLVGVNGEPATPTGFDSQPAESEVDGTRGRTLPAPAAAQATSLSRRDRAGRRATSGDPSGADQPPPGSPSAIDPTRPWWSPPPDGTGTPVAGGPGPARPDAPGGLASTGPLNRSRRSAPPAAGNGPAINGFPGGPDSGPLWQPSNSGENLFSRPETPRPTAPPVDQSRGPAADAVDMFGRPPVAKPALVAPAAEVPVPPLPLRERPPVAPPTGAPEFTPPIGFGRAPGVGDPYRSDPLPPAGTEPGPSLFSSAPRARPVPPPTFAPPLPPTSPPPAPPLTYTAPPAPVNPQTQVFPAVPPAAAVPPSPTVSRWPGGAARRSGRDQNQAPDPAPWEAGAPVGPAVNQGAPSGSFAEMMRASGATMPQIPPVPSFTGQSALPVSPPPPDPMSEDGYVAFPASNRPSRSFGRKARKPAANRSNDDDAITPRSLPVWAAGVSPLADDEDITKTPASALDALATGPVPKRLPVDRAVIETQPPPAWLERARAEDPGNPQAGNPNVRKDKGRSGPARNGPPEPVVDHGRAGRNLPAAIGVGVGLAALALVSLFTRPEAFVALASVVVILAVWELSGALGAKQVVVPVIPVAVGSIGMLVSAYVAGEQGLLVSFALTGFGILLWRIIDGVEGALRDVTAGLFTAAYVPLLAGFAILLLADEDGPKRVVTFILVTVASDIGGYIAGVLFGRTPMAPTISPKKSWEGFAGSVVGCLLVGTASVVVLLGGDWWVGLVLGAAAAVTATLGDLSESLLKRDLGIKDMGTLLPGHGGIMDRLDSLLPVAPVAFLLLHFLVS